MKGFYKSLRRLCAVVVGLVFFLAGMVKLMDPVGAGLVVNEYFKFFHLSFLAFSSKFVGVGMALLETVLGAALVCGVWRKLTGAVTGIVMLLFTVLTFVLWLANPVMDCGCFGEAVHLTHLQSLLKNVILLVLCLVAFVPFASLGVPRRGKYAAFLIVVISVGLFTMYSVLSIPMIDFTDYRCGSELWSEAGLEEDDPEWDLSANLIVPLPFSNAEGEYCDSLACDGRVMVISVYDPSSVSGQDWVRMSSFMDDAAQFGYTPLLLVASTPYMMEEMVSGAVLVRCFYADRKTLMTLNRSNGGVTLVSDGQLIRKWASRSIPDKDELSRYIKADPSATMMNFTAKGRIRFEGFLLYAAALMLLL